MKKTRSRKSRDTVPLSSQKRPSNTSKYELLPIFFYFCGSFLPSWIRIRIPNTDPDPQTRLNTDPIRIPDPDPQPCPKLVFRICDGSGSGSKTDPFTGLRIRIWMCRIQILFFSSVAFRMTFFLLIAV